MAEKAVLTEEQIIENKERFLEIINSFTEHEFDKQRLVDYLVNSDFFTAPASVKYHSAFKGGLCYHSLSTYDTLRKYIKMAFPDKVVASEDDENSTETVSTSPYSEETVALVALLHDISKTKFYEEYQKNVKKYSDTGKKYDDYGKFDWTTQTEYKIVDESKRFIFGTHTETSLFMVQSLIPTLKTYEAMAILHHMGKSVDSTNDRDVAPAVYNKCALALLLHQADEYSALYLEERYVNE